ncbi:MAG: hypothetical protein NZ841_08470 [Dictyoglomus sp.]|nr:hypothetical protein [Dictyoglomus sp.]MDW8189316.1 hypothetical protein [Dictyoglomus sp.]
MNLKEFFMKNKDYIINFTIGILMLLVIYLLYLLFFKKINNILENKEKEGVKSNET